MPPVCPVCLCSPEGERFFCVLGPHSPSGLNEYSMRLHMTHQTTKNMLVLRQDPFGTEQRFSIMSRVRVLTRVTIPHL